MHDQVMVAVDLRSPNHRAIDEAAVLARSHEADLLVVVPYPSTLTFTERAAADAAPHDQHWRLSPGSRAEDAANDAIVRARRLAGPSVRIRTRCEPGRPADVVLGLAEELRPDLLVLGRSAHRSKSAFTPRVLRSLEGKAACEVFVVDANRPTVAPATVVGVDTQMA